MWDLVRFEWLGILSARAAVGLVFLISGSGKLWRADKRASMRKTLEDAHIPAARVTALFVSSVEFVCGALLLVGALTPIACLLLSAVMIMAIATTRIHDVKATTLSGWLGDFLYLPEVLYLLILVWLLFSGPGWFSVDGLIRSRFAQ